jgi:hypothetical protein
MRTSKTHKQPPERQHPNPKRGVVALAATLLVATAIGGLFNQPASAQGLSYWPWAIGSSLMYPMRYMGYGMGGMYGGGYGGMYGNYGNYNNSNNYGYSPYGNPGYTNMGWYNGSILQRATRGLGGPGYNGYSATGNPNFTNVNNNAQANATPPNVMKYGGAYPPGNQGATTNQTGTPDANAIYPNNAAPGSPAANGSANFSNSNYPAPNYGGMQFPGGPQGQGSYMSGMNGMSGMGGLGGMNGPNGMNGQYSYTDRHGRIKYKKNKYNNQPGQSGNGSGNQGAGSGGSGAGSGIGSGATSTSTAPFAGAFINNVNSEYQGDIRKAMSNPQTRAWAQSLGVTNSASSNFAISDERSGVIEHVLKDSSLDPVSKLDAIKILMRN